MILKAYANRDGPDQPFVLVVDGAFSVKQNILQYSIERFCKQLPNAQIRLHTLTAFCKKTILLRFAS